MRGNTRSGIGAALALGVVAASLAHAEPDGVVAPAGRWFDARGTPSGSRRSDAQPVTRGVEEAWSVRFPAGAVASAPVTWDGLLYVVAGAGGDRVLYAVDLTDGAVVADRRLHDAPETQPAVWDGRVYLRDDTDRLEAFEVTGAAMNRRWVWRADGPVGDPVVFEGELYVVTGGEPGTLVKLRAGFSKPLWAASTEGQVVARPAIHGRHVYLLERDGEELAVGAWDRESGGRAAWGRFAPCVGRDRGEGAVVVAEQQLFVASPRAIPTQDGGGCMHAILSVHRAGGVPRFGLDDPGLVDLLAPPAVTRQGVVALTRGRHPIWALWRGSEAAILAARPESPDLFASPVPPTALGDVVYFGTWAADIETLQVLWRLPVERVRYGAVPADGMVIVVDGDGVLRAYRERGAS